MDSALLELDRFFKSAVQNLESASKAVIYSRAQSLKIATQQELRSVFKRRVGGVSVKELPPTASLGAAAYVSVKPRFLAIFQTGGIVRPESGGFLPVLLPGGKKLGFGRVNKKGLARVLAANQGRIRWVRSRRGWVILFRRDAQRAARGDRKRGSVEIPIYALVPEVALDKRLNFVENAERIGRGMDEAIARLLNG